MSECSEEIKRAFLIFASDVGLSDEILSVICPVIKCRRAGDSYNLFCLTKDLARFLDESFSNTEKDDLLVIGLQAGRREKSSFIPSMALAYALADFTDLLKESCAVLRKGKEIVFTHGKPVSKDDFKVQGLNKKIYLVLTWRKEPVGWGILKDGKLIPIMDAGWFIRSGY